MKEYEIEKVEKYFIKANSYEEAKAIVQNTDSGSALTVSYELIREYEEEVSKV